MRTSTIKAPGWPRWFAVATVSALAVLLSLLVYSFGHLGDLAVAAAILLISLAAHSVIALLTFDSQRGWRAVDYPWVAASFVAIIVAIANIAENSWQAQFQELKYTYQSSLGQFREAASNLLKINCKQEPPYNNDICSKLETAITITGWQAKDVGAPKIYLTMNDIGLNPEPYLMDLEAIIGGTSKKLELQLPVRNPVAQAWFYTDIYLKSINSLRSLYEASYNKDIKHKSGWKYILVTKAMRYWYFAPAYFVGLRLSRTTAELLQAMQMGRPRGNGTRDLPRIARSA